MTTTATTTPSIVSALQTIFGSTFNGILKIGKDVVYKGTSMTDTSLLGVPFLTISAIAITSMVMAYVTIGDTSDSDSNDSMTNNTPAIPPIIGGRKRRTRKLRLKNGRKTIRRS